MSDLISRKAAIEAIDNFSTQIIGLVRGQWGTVTEAVTGERYTLTKDEVKKLLNALPPAEEPRNHCPNCGARMKGEI